jgi:hypothetical protein
MHFVEIATKREVQKDLSSAEERIVQLKKIFVSNLKKSNIESSNVLICTKPEQLLEAENGEKRFCVHTNGTVRKRCVCEQ